MARILKDKETRPERAKRLAAALKANIRRRKDQARERARLKPGVVATARERE